MYKDIFIKGLFSKSKLQREFLNLHIAIKNITERNLHIRYAMNHCSDECPYETDNMHITHIKYIAIAIFLHDSKVYCSVKATKICVLNGRKENQDQI